MKETYNSYNTIIYQTARAFSKQDFNYQIKNVEHVEITHFDSSVTGQTFLTVLVFNDDERSSELVER